MCDTKASDISETKQSRANVTKECLQKLFYDLSIGDKSEEGWTVAYFSGDQNFSTTDLTHFLSDRDKI